MAQVTSGTSSVGEVHVTGRRVLATLVDFVLIAILSLLFSLLFGSGTSGDGGVSVSVTGFPAVVLFVIVFGYYTYMEGRYGQTVGKMLVGIRVVSTSGSTPGFGKAAIRTVLRIVDGFFFYLVAFIIVLISGRNQRLGDMAAGTLVVRR